jgi:hypothetical protein
MYPENVDHVLKMIENFDHVYKNINQAFQKNVEQVFEKY